MSEKLSLSKFMYETVAIGASNQLPISTYRLQRVKPGFSKMRKKYNIILDFHTDPLKP